MRVVFVLLAMCALLPYATAVSAAPQVEGLITDGTRVSDDGREEAKSTPGAPSLSLEGPIDSDTYVLGPLDQLFLILRGVGTTRVERLTVLPEGTVILPNAGILKAAGMTLTEFRMYAAKALKPYYKNSVIDFQLARPRSFLVYVLGSVNNPRSVELRAPFRIGRAIQRAGGVRGNGSSRSIEIREGGEVVRSVDLFLFNRFGAFEHNPTLKEGQTVYVPARGKRAAIVGEVLIPGTYELLPGDTVDDLIRFAGGFTARGNRSAIELERAGGASAKPGQRLTADEAADVELDDLDVVVVPDIRSLDENEPVRVLGGGGRQGDIYIEKDVTLAAFLPRLSRFTPNFDIENAVVERAGNAFPPELIYFSVGEVLAGDSLGTMVLHPGDVISFPPIDTQVYVAGEVISPGAFPYRPGISAQRYVALAGGPNESGSFSKIKILSRDGEERDAELNSTVYRGETVIVGVRTAKRLGSLFVGLVSVTSLILSVIAVSK
ncbi:MAG: SLBB domain-containing protein [bacterium]|nr:SLBB domain-containing protein [bacterium]